MRLYRIGIVMLVCGGLGLGCPPLEKGDGSLDRGDTGGSDTSPTDDTAPAEDTDPDADGDGYPSSEDCDESDANVHPGVDEICDGIDQNCDGQIDEGLALQTWYLDGDEDGYGGSSDTSACAQPTGYAATNTDCDDFDLAVHPGADETCNGVDDDCDDTVDDGEVCSCDSAVYGGHTYLFCDGVLSWNGAESACAADGYGLAQVDDEAENSFLAAEGYAFGGGQYFWICATTTASKAPGSAGARS